jgi:hypothetical protein
MSYMKHSCYIWWRQGHHKPLFWSAFLAFWLFILRSKDSFLLSYIFLALIADRTFLETLASWRLYHNNLKNSLLVVICRAFCKSINAFSCEISKEISHRPFPFSLTRPTTSSMINMYRRFFVIHLKSSILTVFYLLINSVWKNMCLLNLIKQLIVF